MSLPSLRSNILALGALQLGNYLIPLLTVPYMARVLGAEGYGQVVFVQTWMSFGVLWIDFGFNWLAVKLIAADRNKPDVVSRIFVMSWLIQWVLFALACLVFGVAGWFLGAAGQMLWVGCGMLLGHVLFPLWLFQGLEMMRAVTFIQLGGRISAFPLLFWMVGGPDDQLMAVMFFSMTSIATGGLSLLWLMRMEWIQWSRPSFMSLKILFLESAGLFVSRLSMSLYSNFIPLAVGLWAGKEQLACYSLADKVKSLFQQLMIPVSQALYPRMSWLFKNDVASIPAIISKTVCGIVALGLSAGLLLFLGSEQVIALLGGAQYAAAAQVLQWLAWIPLLDALFNLMGIQILLAVGRHTAFRNILLLVACVGFPVLYISTTSHGALGTAWVVVFMQIMLVVTTFWYIYSQYKSGQIKL